ncbi:DUF4843 domain-containing protein [Sphingobacterium sp.]
MILVGSLSVSCQRDQLMSFEQKAKVYIYKTNLINLATFLTRDSVTYSFAVLPDYARMDTVFIPIRIMGDAAERDRKVNYELMAVSDADKESYELLPALIKANKFEGRIPVLVKKTTSLKVKESRLWLKITASDDFEPGIVSQLTYLIRINNFLSRPATWSDYYFGKYSNTKYKFIIENTGYTAFNQDYESEIMFIVQTCKNALLEYESLHNETLMDEDGEEIIFP